MKSDDVKRLAGNLESCTEKAQKAYKSARHEDDRHRAFYELIAELDGLHFALMSHEEVSS